LSALTLPLFDGTASVTTGYRWYVAETGNIPTLLRSAWNASVLSMLGDHHRNFAWGGSMALRRETFERLDVRGAWRGAVSDDFALTQAARRAGAKIVFVPSCVIPSYGVCGWRELLEFTTRQITLTRVYHPELWRVGFLAQSVFNLTFFGLLAAIAVAPGRAAVVLWLAISILTGLKAWIRFEALKYVLPSLSKHNWFYILSPPLVALLFEYNMLRSAFSRRIVWRQIRYDLISPSETRVERPPGSGASAN
jgi:hypothetical protein